MKIQDITFCPKYVMACWLTEQPDHYDEFKREMVNRVALKVVLVGGRKFDFYEKDDREHLLDCYDKLTSYIEENGR